MRRLRWPFEYVLMRAAMALLGRRDPGARMRLAGRAGRFMARWLPVRADLIKAQLGLAFPEKAPAEIATMLPEVYTHVVAFGLELLTMPRLTRQDILAQFDIDPEVIEHFRRLKEAGRGIIGVTGHIGNWEWCAACGTEHGYEVVAVAKPMHNPMSERFIQAMRDHAGIRIVSTEASMKPLVSHLRKGGLIGLVADQDAGRDGLFVDFFGRRASTATGPAWLARRLKAPIINLHSHRQPNGRIAIQCDPPIESDPGLGEDEDVRRMTQLCAAQLEAAIRRHPAQYFWVHRRWKTKEKVRTKPAPATNAEPSPQS